ncbi:hypothetical protein THIOKS12760018 [Thiocapsa sp. KS1]|jgi:hypothetical protein|nr:hypothetical protein THIOKS12760018 [Thiocapsa sp. KS1]
MVLERVTHHDPKLPQAFGFGATAMGTAMQTEEAMTTQESRHDAHDERHAGCHEVR